MAVEVRPLLALLLGVDPAGERDLTDGAERVAGCETELPLAVVIT